VETLETRKMFTSSVGTGNKEGVYLKRRSGNAGNKEGVYLKCRSGSAGNKEDAYLIYLSNLPINQRLQFCGRGSLVNPSQGEREREQFS
jgi:hypothetical protein